MAAQLAAPADERASRAVGPRDDVRVVRAASAVPERPARPTRAVASVRRARASRNEAAGEGARPEAPTGRRRRPDAQAAEDPVPDEREAGEPLARTRGGRDRAAGLPDRAPTEADAAARLRAGRRVRRVSPRSAG